MGCGAFGTAGCGVWGGRGGGEFHLNEEEGAGEGDSSTWVGGEWEEMDLREGGGELCSGGGGGLGGGPVHFIGWLRHAVFGNLVDCL